MDDGTDARDVTHPDRVTVRVTHGEESISVGGPGDYPDRAEVTIEPGSEFVQVRLDASSGDHGTAHADVDLTPAEARTLRDLLDETVRWMGEE